MRFFDMPQSKRDRRQKNVTPFDTHGDTVFRNDKNRQINQVTRESLSIALIYLMNEKPFEKISITELVERAGVSRTAFYRNYESKEDLLSEIGKSLISRMHELNGMNRNGKLSYDWYLELFKTIKEHKESFSLFINANLTAKMLFNQNTFVDVVFPSSEKTERYRLIAEEGAMNNVITTWFSEGMKESPEEMAELCATLIKKQ